MTTRILPSLSSPSIKGDAADGTGDGRKPICDVHHAFVFRAPSLLRDVARRVHEGRYLNTRPVGSKLHTTVEEHERARKLTHATIKQKRTTFSEGDGRTQVATKDHLCTETAPPRGTRKHQRRLDPFRRTSNGECCERTVGAIQRRSKSTWSRLLKFFVRNEQRPRTQR